MLKPFLLFICLFVIFVLETSGQKCNEPNSIVSVTTTKSGRSEFVIFTLKKPTNVTPKITEASLPFIHDGSGDTLKIKGCRYKQVTFKNIVWTCSIAQNIQSNSYLIQEVKNIGQFEGQINFIVGYNCKAKSIVSYTYNDGDYKKCVVRFKY